MAGHTAIPYRVSTGPEQGFPCVVFPHREKPVFSSWDPCNENRIFPVGNTTQGKLCFHYMDGFAVYIEDVLEKWRSTCPSQAYFC